MDDAADDVSEFLGSDVTASGSSFFNNASALLKIVMVCAAVGLVAVLGIKLLNIVTRSRRGPKQ
ncbi:MAG: hypothetical protein MZU97_09875 [Bacillus subtilis]|nr:hypothetical protein [Bacillus subtilis]